MAEPGQDEAGHAPPGMAEHNRDIVAERLGWPDEAVEACRETEAGAPGWHCWWTPSPWPDPGFAPAYGAAQIERRPLTAPNLHARSPDELAELIKAEDARRPAERADA